MIRIHYKQSEAVSGFSRQVLYQLSYRAAQLAESNPDTQANEQVNLKNVYTCMYIHHKVKVRFP